MFSSSKNSTQRTFHATQSLFQFLKRKKQTELQNSLKINSASKSSRKDYHNRTRSVIYNTLDQFGIQQNNSNQNIQSYNSISQSITPRKIRFDFQKKDSANNKNRPFIQMISPLKGKINNFSDKKQGQSISTKNIQKGTDLYSKKKINESINLIKNTFHLFVQAGKSTKQKCNAIFCKLSQITKIILQRQLQSDKNLGKQISELKINFKAIQSTLNIFESTNTSQLLQQFHKMLSEHLNTIQSVNNQKYKNYAEQEIKAITSETNFKIRNLQTTIHQITRQKTQLQKGLLKVKAQLQNTIQKFEERQNNFIQQKQKISIKLTQQIKQLSQQNKRKNIILIQTQNTLKQLEKQLKNQKYTRQFLQKRDSKEQQLVRQTKQKFLIQQIQKLKIQFTSDIDKLHILYQTKNKELFQKIECLQKQLSLTKEQKNHQKQVVLKILQEANFLKQQNSSLLKKNDSILIDMYRMNQQLYQHWLALKDIKTLSERLCIFQNFKIIYKDLSFNPLLFN